MRLLLTSGFLGSGKTTAIMQAARCLEQANKKVGIITNDQGDQQVDTVFLKSVGLEAREVLNGCFCCNYQQLDTCLDSLSYCDIVFAESVGSCTDLIATIAKPLQHYKPHIEIMISTFVDGRLLSDIIAGRSAFQEESVRYIYKKQLEEADLLIVNKIDLLDGNELKHIDEVIQAAYPGKIITHQSSFNKDDISKWLSLINDFTLNHNRQSIEIDYDIYSKGESKLAWLDRHIAIKSSCGDAIFVTGKIIGAIADRIQSQRLAIGHVKFFLESDQYKEKISFTSTSTSNDFRLRKQSCNLVNLLINARVETDPQTLKNLVDEVLLGIEKIYRCEIISGKWSVFKPGYPRPAHRIA